MAAIRVVPQASRLLPERDAFILKEVPLGSILFDVSTRWKSLRPLLLREELIDP